MGFYWILMDMFTSRGPRTIAKLICKSNNYGLRQVYVTCVVNGVKLYLYIYTHLANVWGKCQYSIHWSQWAMCSWDITILTNMFCRCNCQQFSAFTSVINTHTTYSMTRYQVALRKSGTSSNIYT